MGDSAIWKIPECPVFRSYFSPVDVRFCRGLLDSAAISSGNVNTTWK